jgi:hypothetical protein
MPAADVEQLIPPALERVESMIGYLVVEEPPQGAEVEIDGRSVVWEPKLPLNPGTHQLLVDHPDYEPFQGSITLGAGQTELVRLTLQRRETAPQKSAPTPTVATPADGGKPGSAQRVVFWTSVGVSGVGVGTGVVGVILFGGASSRGKELGRDVDEISGGGASACSSPNPAAPETCAELEKVGRQRDTAGALMVGGFAAAGAGALGALVSHYFWPTERGQVRLQAEALPGRSFVSLSGAF